MDSSRLIYLQAMGIDVWVPREGEAPGPGAVTAAAGMAALPPRGSADAIAANTAAVRPMGKGVAATPGGANNDVDGLDWAALEERVRPCTLCDLHKGRTQTVFGVGDRAAQWMVIGEAPGAEEDRRGEPFVGRAGQLLNSMLRAIGLRREQVFIANILKCRPPNNRDPTPAEAACCTPYLYRQIELVNPRVLLCVGRIAAQNLLKVTTPIGKLRGQVHTLGQRPMVVTYHPAYLLRSPIEKRKSWEDLRLAMQVFEAADRA